MSDGVSYPPVDISGLLAAIPSPATTAPMPETVAGSVGTPGSYAPAAHSHPRLTSTTLVTLDSTGAATVSFTRSFASKPGVVLTEVESTNAQPVVFQVQSYTGSAGAYTGVTIKGYRASLLPALAMSLLGFNIFAGSAAGAEVSVVAIARSDI